MRKGNFIWGLIVVFIGVMLLLDNLGYLPGNAWGLIWPGVLILVWLWFLFGARLFRGQAVTQQLSIPLETARRVNLTIEHGAGKLILGAHNRPGELLSGTFENGVESKLHREGDLAEIKLEAPFDVIIPGAMVGAGGMGWQIGLATEPVYRLKVESGASQTQLDLTDLQVADLRVSTGASSTDIIMPARAGFTTVKVDAGVASVNIRVPDGVAAQISVEQGLSGVDIDANRFPRSGDLYLSPDYATAANRTDIRVEAGVGSITIR